MTERRTVAPSRRRDTVGAPTSLVRQIGFALVTLTWDPDHHHLRLRPKSLTTLQGEILMNIALWIVAALLAVAFLASGAMKLIQPKEKLASGLGWVDDFSAGAVKAIGTLEVLAAVGLILPAALDIAPVLVPLAAVGLVVLMVGAVITHLRRHEAQAMVVSLVLLAVAAVVVWGRFGPYSFTG